MPKVYFLSIAICVVVASFQSQIRRSQKWSALATAKETPNCRETAGLHLTFFPNAAHLDLSAFSRISPLFGEGVFGALSKVTCTPLNLWFRWTKKGGGLVRENKRESSLAYILAHTTLNSSQFQEQRALPTWPPFGIKRVPPRFE